jgi:hypothetical protein
MQHSAVLPFSVSLLHKSVILCWRSGERLLWGGVGLMTGMGSVGSWSVAMFSLGLSTGFRCLLYDDSWSVHLYFG